MGWFGVLFLIFGWVFNIKGLIITSLVLSAVFLFLNILAEVVYNKNRTFDLVVDCTTLILCIVRLCM